MTICIFGGVGFIGTNISLFALSRGHKVITFDNLSRCGVVDNLTFLQKKSGFTFIHGDVRTKEDFVHIPHSVDCLINLAANPAIPISIKEPFYDFSCNVIGHMNVLEFSKENGQIPVILASSNKAYTDKMNTFPIKELKTRYVYADKKYQNGFGENEDVSGHEGYTNSPYGAGKLAAEKYSREYWKQYKIPIVINRMSCIYGLYQKGVADQGWVDHFLRMKKQGGTLTLYGSGKQVRDVLYAGDLAKLYIYEAEHMAKVNGKTFNVGGGIQTGFHISLLELINLIDSHFPGKKLRYTFAPWRESDQRIYQSDISFVRKVTKWQPETTILKGLSRMWRAYDE